MYKHFVHIENSLCGLEQKVTGYVIGDDLGLVFDSYYENSRPTKRHKFIIGNRWERLSSRDSNVEKPIVRDAVKENILSQAKASIHFKDKL